MPLEPIILLLTIGGGYYALTAWVSLRQSGQSQAWPTVPGRVVAAGLRSRILFGRFAPPVIRYRYVVDGESHECERLAFRHSYTIAEARGVLYHYPAVLEVEEGMIEQVVFVAGLLAVSAGIGLLIWTAVT